MRKFRPATAAVLTLALCALAVSPALAAPVRPVHKVKPPKWVLRQAEKNVRSWSDRRARAAHGNAHPSNTWAYTRTGATDNRVSDGQVLSASRADAQSLGHPCGYRLPAPCRDILHMKLVYLAIFHRPNASAAYGIAGMGILGNPNPPYVRWDQILIDEDSNSTRTQGWDLNCEYDPVNNPFDCDPYPD